MDTYFGYTRVQNGIIKHEWTYSDHWKVYNTILEGETELPEFDPLPSNASAIDTSKTYVTYEFNYEWQPVGNETALYQIPVIKSTVLPYGTYTVVIAPSYTTMFDHNYTTDADGKRTYKGSYDFYLDAIRTYAPAESYDQYNKKYYNFDGEGWPEFIEVRDNIIGEAVDAGTDEISGIVFIDSAAANESVTDYKYYGPNNEVYLDPGQAITFSLKTAKNRRIVDSVQIGAKRLEGEATEITATVGTGDDARSETVRITGSTDMYYKICTDMRWASCGATDDPDALMTKSEQITITNTSKTSSVSLTSIKITYFEQPEKPIELVVDGEGLTAAISIAALEYLDSISECYHDFEFMMVTSPTETTEGLLRVVCTDCGEAFEIVLPVLNEKNYSVISEVEPTATEDGRIIFKWVTTDYGDVEVVVEIPALGEAEEQDPTFRERIQQSIEKVISFIKKLFEYLTGLFKF